MTAPSSRRRTSHCSPLLKRFYWTPLRTTPVKFTLEAFPVSARATGDRIHHAFELGILQPQLRGNLSRTEEQAALLSNIGRGPCGTAWNPQRCENLRKRILRQVAPLIDQVFIRNGDAHLPALPRILHYARFRHSFA